MLLTSLAVFLDTLRKEASTAHIRKFISISRASCFDLNLLGIIVKNSDNWSRIVSKLSKYFQKSSTHDLHIHSAARGLPLLSPHYGLLFSKASLSSFFSSATLSTQRGPVTLLISSKVDRDLFLFYPTIHIRFCTPTNTIHSIE